jgi:CTP synthase (UTP-ammonia lyase)
MNEHTAHPVVNLWKNKKQLLIKVEQCGAWKCDIKKDTLPTNLWKRDIFERHRHRYEYNKQLCEQLQKLDCYPLE